MTFIEAFDKIRVKLLDADTSAFDEFTAIQVNLTDDDCGGAFYIEYKNGNLAIEPYDYVDRNASITTTRLIFTKLINGTMIFDKAVADSKVFVDGDYAKAKLVTTLLRKATTTAAAKKTTVKKSTKASAEKPSLAKKIVAGKSTKKDAKKSEQLEIKLNLDPGEAKKTVTKRTSK